MLDAAAAGEEVEGDVQDMVGFVIGQMPLEQMEIAVDVARSSPILLSQQEHGADAAGGEAADAIGQFVVDVGGGHHGLVAFGAGSIRDAVQDSPLAFAEESAVAFSRLLTALRLSDLFSGR